MVQFRERVKFRVWLGFGLGHLSFEVRVRIKDLV